jgi:transposase
MVSEAYSSKTCSECGHIKTDLNGNKVYRCDGCPNVSDRDWNGARGILVRFLTEWARIEDAASVPIGTVVDLTGDD